MPQRHGLPHKDVAIAVVTKVVKIGAADGGTTDGNLNFVCRGRSEFSRFLTSVSLQTWPNNNGKGNFARELLTIFKSLTP